MTVSIRQLGLIVCTTLLCFLPDPSHSQDYRPAEARIERLLIDGETDQALNELITVVSDARENQSPSQAAAMVYWLGKVELRLTENSGFPEAIALNDSLVTSTRDPLALYLSQLGLSRLHNEAGNLASATELGKKALEAAVETGEPEYRANALYYLGEYGLRSGDFGQFQENTRASLALVEKSKDYPFAISSRTYNYMGALMYLSGQADSSVYYYEKALRATGSMRPNSENRLYFPATVKSNMVLLYQSLNDFDNALRLSRESIVLNGRFLREDPNHPLRFRALRNQSLAYRNLASLYDQLGDYTNMKFISERAYRHAKKNFRPDLLEYFSGVTLFAEALISNREFDQAIQVLQEAKKSLEMMEQDNPLLQANYHVIAASTHYGLGDFERARVSYEKGRDFHRLAESDPLSNDRVFADINLALCYTGLGLKDEAYGILEELLAPLIEAENDRLVNALLTARARTAFAFSDYEGVLENVKQFLELNGNPGEAGVAQFLSEIYLLEAKARYARAERRDLPFLQRMDNLLAKALQVLENRKIAYASGDNSDELIRENLEVFDFSKQIKKDLFELGKEQKYLDQLLQVHESSIYHRIRSRLNSEKYAVDFNLPVEITQREQALKRKRAETGGSVEDFVSYQQEWEVFLDSVQRLHPRYFELRYASIATDLSGVQETLGEDTQVIRFFFIDQTLYACLIDTDGRSLIRLETGEIDSEIARLADYQTPPNEMIGILNSLHRKLWVPLEDHIDGQRLIILPDGPLFNLSFELLPLESIRLLEEIPEKGLLSKFDLSYQYSLQLLAAPTDYSSLDHNYLAFAPGFTREMKNAYTQALQDSTYIDPQYLNLLPQPFTLELAEAAKRDFKGSLQKLDSATKNRFASQAGGHHVLHIGSHAESNNLNPGYSRLLFAKDLNDTVHINDNSLYAYEIYNLDLAADLTVLTACETGRPGYQPGEGMVSLAHAFNYAGSRSMLTSLWQIDEEASTLIIKAFYRYLKKGQPKDRALRMAKLDYMEQAEGRSLHPQYWAGLIVMGDASPIDFEEGSFPWWWVVLAILLIYAVYRNKKAFRNGRPS